MPTVGDLHCLRQGLGRSLAISAATVTGDDRDRGMRSEPRLGGRGLTIRQQGDYPAPFQVADDDGVPVIAPPGPIVNANDLERVSRWTTAASDHAQERVFAHRQHQPFCEACRRSTTKRQAEVMSLYVNVGVASFARTGVPPPVSASTIGLNFQHWLERIVLGWHRSHDCSEQGPDARGQSHGQRTPERYAYGAHRHTRAARAPKSARNSSEVAGTRAIRLVSGTKAVVRRGMAAPTPRRFTVD
jgi:hypothetical protein